MIYWLIAPTTAAATSNSFSTFHPDQPQRVTSNRLLVDGEHIGIEIQVGADWFEIARIDHNTNREGYTVAKVSAPHRVVKPVTTAPIGAYLDML